MIEINEHIRNSMLENLTDSKGCENLWCFKLQESGDVTDMWLAASGNESSVPALLPHIGKSDLIIHNHPSGDLNPSANDLEIAQLLGQSGIGFYITDNLVSRFRVVAEPVLTESVIPLDENSLEEILLPDGLLSRFVKDYELRESQLHMMTKVVNAFNSEKILAVEAGTGTGKSFAYLFPAVKWVKNNNQKIIIATATINLQKQLFDKDIPLVSRVCRQKPRVELVLGRNNYVCLKRLFEYKIELEIQNDREISLDFILDWVAGSDTGSIRELAEKPLDYIWSSINSEPDLCVGIRCKYHSKCFFFKARKKAASAQIIIVNHHLLFADLSSRLQGAGFENNAVLPAYGRLIIDEAHNMERNATSYFSESFNNFKIIKSLNLIINKKGRRFTGSCSKIKDFIPVQNFIVDVYALREEILRRNDVLQSLTGDLMLDVSSVWLNTLQEEQRQRYLNTPLKDLEKAMADFIHYIKRHMELVDEKLQYEPDYIEVQSILNKVTVLASFISKFIDFQDKEEKVFWIDRKRDREGKNYYSFYITPLEVSALIRESIFDKCKTVICTSATLSVNNNLKFWLKRVGLSGVSEDELETAILPSPFNHNRVLLASPSNAPEPSNSKQYDNFLKIYLPKLLRISEGKALVLFTSYYLLNQCFNFLQQSGITNEYPVYRQGQMDNAFLHKKFNKEINSILLATDSFWEGIDSPGDTLKNVIITRLPFRVPSEPVNKARYENISANGRNPFFELSVPEAIMKLKQGYGRLMRSKKDHGTVIVLDSRLVTKNYGKLFINSLPESQKYFGPMDNVLDEIENFLYNKEE